MKSVSRRRTIRKTPDDAIRIKNKHLGLEQICDKRHLKGIVFKTFQSFSVAVAVALFALVSFGGQDDMARPLPSVKTVLERVAKQAEKEDAAERAFKEHYSYIRSKLTETRNSDGDLKKREEKVRAHYPEFPPAAAEPEPSKKESSGEDSQNSDKINTRGKAFKKSDFAMTADLLDRFEFTVTGRETIRGRPALIVDFVPANKKVPERSLKDKFINKAAGRVWIDEEDYALVKADLHLTERVNVVGGLVGSVSKFNYSFDRERTEDGWWFARNVDWHLEAREVFFNRTIDYHEVNSDFKKVWAYDTASKSK
jgi:hypothetical protein